MDIKHASRLDGIKTGVFAAINAEKDKLIREGRKVYNLFIGTPDFEPPQHIIDALVESAKDPSIYIIINFSPFSANFSIFSSSSNIRGM